MELQVTWTDGWWVKHGLKQSKPKDKNNGEPPRAESVQRHANVTFQYLGIPWGGDGTPAEIGNEVKALSNVSLRYGLLKPRTSVLINWLLFNPHAERY